MRCHSGVLLPVFAAFLLVACDQTATSPAESGTISRSLGSQPSSPQVGTERLAEAELFEVCKDYVGAVGPAVVVNVNVDSHEAGPGFANFDVTLADGECLDVWVHGGTGLDVVTVTETVPAGYASSFDKTVVGTNTAASGPGNSASGNVDGTSGVLVVFTNEELPPPGEGCTPGFWKNHLSDWGPTGLSPGDDFDTTFGVDLFDPDITLDDAVNLGGGGVRKLARHGTAALLNALHPAVSYPLSAAQVIAAVQAGDSDTLAGFNELGCDLGS